MREILFRGKKIENGEWIVGNLTIWSDKTTSIDAEPTEGSILWAVVPETVGQYTGLTDKNGKKVFEGDIVKNEYRKGQYQYFKIAYDTRVYCWQVENKYGMLGFLYNVIGDLEVIGNIHDNKELLEVKR